MKIKKFKLADLMIKNRTFFLMCLIFFIFVSCKKKSLDEIEGKIIPDPIFKEKKTAEIQNVIDLSYNWKFDSALIEIKSLRDKNSL